GVYWVATGAGICRLDLSGRSPKDRKPICANYVPDETDGADNVFRLFEDHSGTVWAGTFSGVYRLEGKAAQPKFQFVDFGMPKMRDDSLVQDIIEDRLGSLWVATRGSGLYRRLPDGRIEHYYRESGLPPRINTLRVADDGYLWAGTSEKGIYRLRTNA